MDADITENIEPLLACVEAFDSATVRADRVQLLARIRDQLEKLQSADEKSQTALDEFYKKASEGGLDAAEAEKAALASREGEIAAMELLRPRILSLQRYLIDTTRFDDPEAHQLLQKAINVAVGYMAGYQNLRDQLISFTHEKQATTDGVLRARPLKGKIDYPELSREHLARYPKIRAALAK
jgi:hypothetical protein